MDIYVDLANTVFPRLWRHLCSLRNISGNRNSYEKANRTKKKRLVLVQLLLLRRMRNTKLLKWWSVIQAVGYYGWGVGRTALDTFSSWGVVSHSQTRTAALKILCKNLVKKQTAIFSKERAICFVLDNYGETVKLKQQRGGHSAKRLSGTHEIAHRINPFTDTSFDDITVPITYDLDQAYPSPVCMADYENDACSFAAMLLQHKTRSPSTAPCRTGSRVRAHMRNLVNTNWICELSNAFSTDLATAHKDLPQSVNQSSIAAVEELVRKPSTQSVLAAARDYQRQSRRIWNPDGDKPSHQSYMGLVAMDEDTSRQNGALGLDLSSKCALLAKDANGKWIPGKDADVRRIYIVGDVKTTDLLEKCLHNINHSPGMSGDFSQFVEKEVFRDTLARLIIQPGDWHAGLSCLQTVYNIFWDDVLQPVCKKLKWKRVGKDCRECYFNASRLLRYTYHQLLKILMQNYISEQWPLMRLQFESTEEDSSEENYLCFVAVNFGDWLEKLHTSNDEWLRACSFFIRISRDFFAFVRAYRTGDSVAVENGYQTFAAPWRATGQHRYHSRHWIQLEYMLDPRYGTFMLLEEWRRNRQVNPHPGELNKNMLTKDEDMELANRFLNQFPKMACRAGFALQANYVGIAKMCKRFILQLKSLNSQKKRPSAARSAKEVPAIREKIFIYQLFAKLGTEKIVPGRLLKPNMVELVARTMKVDLKEGKLEDAISGNKDDEAYQLLSSIGQILDQPEDPENESPWDWMEAGAEEEPAEDEETEIRKNLLDARDCFTVEVDDQALTSEQLLTDDDAGRALSSAVNDPEEEEEEDDAEDDPEMSGQQDNAQGTRKEKRDQSKKTTKSQCSWASIATFATTFGRWGRSAYEWTT